MQQSTALEPTSVTVLTWRNMELPKTSMLKAGVTLKMMALNKSETGPNNPGITRERMKRVRLTGIVCSWACGSKWRSSKEFVFLMLLNKLKGLRLRLRFITRPYSPAFYCCMTCTSQRSTPEHFNGALTSDTPPWFTLECGRRFAWSAPQRSKVATQSTLVLHWPIALKGCTQLCHNEAKLVIACNFIAWLRAWLYPRCAQLET